MERFRDVMLASSSVPGMMPPVRINSEVNGRRVSELHVDGGTTAGLFVPKGLLVTAPDGKPSGTNVYVIVAGKLFADPGKVRTRVLPVMATSAPAYSRIPRSSSRASALSSTTSTWMPRSASPATAGGRPI